MPDENTVTYFFSLLSSQDLEQMKPLLHSDARLYFPKTQPLAGRDRILCFFKILSVSENVLGSGTVGPDAMTFRSSPITSDKIRLTTVAGLAILAKPPPFDRDRSFLMVFIS